VASKLARHHAGDAFVIQQHAARRMHYDFRLEHDGVLWSWSVPEGPSLDPRDKRLAVRTEDHPLDDVDFEGAIPAGYGAGAVIVWDRGTWRCDGDAAAAMAKGRITFELAGEKLRGRWHLVRRKSAGKQESWLLFKGNDDAADRVVDVVAENPNSVISRHSIDEVAADPLRLWHAKRALPELVAQLPVGFSLTDLDKVLYEQQGITKAQLVAYLAVVAERMLPHVAGRPLTLVRCPDGVGRSCFYQRHALPAAPAPIRRVLGRDQHEEPAEYMAIDDLAGLVALAQLGALEIHAWGCRVDSIERPDQLTFDLDPDVGLPWSRAVAAALDVRAALDELGLASFAKTTGGKGLHVVVAVARGATWDEHKAFARAIAERVARADPARYTTNVVKARRVGKVYIDYLRNSRTASAIVPYSPRARSGAPVATPIPWDELERGVDPAALTIDSVPKRIATTAEPWADMRAQRVTAAMRRAVGMR
jgi:bifunctional non-homologous end joining protein LigD